MKILGKLIWLLVFVMMLSGFLFLWNAYNAEPIDISKVEPEYHLNAETLIAHFKKENDHLIEANKIVAIEGTIKEINNLNNRMTILLEGGDYETACVICDMQADQTRNLQKFKPKDAIRLKGVFKGFLEDAIFLNCVISPKIDQ